MSRLVHAIERISIVCGRWVGWLTVGMVLLTFSIAVMRYIFDIGFIWMQELVVWMHAAVFMLGAAYTLQRDQHVRVDVVFRDCRPKTKAWINLSGVVLLLLPLCAFLTWVSWDYVVNSWTTQEGSRQAQGLGYPATPLLKSFLILMPIMLALQAIALILRSVATLRDTPIEDAG